MTAKKPNTSAAPKRRRARADAAEMSKRARLHEARVTYIADLMRELKFISGKTTKAVAAEWHLPLAATKEIVGEAAKRVRAEIGEHEDELVARVVLLLDRALCEAAASGDRRAVIDACALLAQIVGVGASKGTTTNELAKLSPEELRSRKAAVLARLTGEKGDEDTP